MPTPGENVVVAGRFRLNRKLGQGGMGSVWHATQLGLDAPCAVKFIEGDYAKLPEMQARFEREAKAAAALRSPHVVQIIDHAMWEGIPFIVMELLDGEDLAHRIEQRVAEGRAMAPDETVTILAQVCRALGKAHALGIVHRDLKPENIYLVKDDDREIAKVLDFGIAKNISLDVGSTTKTGAMLGTPYYMSPEQAQGTKAVDARSDLWAIAVIAYQCLTGQLPFESEALGDLLMKIMIAPPPIPSQVANVPAGFDAWFAKGTAREPAARFQSAKELMDALAPAVLGGGVAHATLVSLPDHTIELTPSYPSSVLTVAAPSADLVPSMRGVSPAVSGPELGAHGTDDRLSTIAGVPKKSSGAVIFVVVAGLFLLVGVGIAVLVVKGRGEATVDPTPSATATAITAASTIPTSTAVATLTSTAAVGTGSPPMPSASASSKPAPTNAPTNIVANNGVVDPHKPKPKGSTAPTAAPPTATAAPTKNPNDLGF